MGGEMSLTKQDQAAERYKLAKALGLMKVTADTVEYYPDQIVLIGQFERDAERRGFCAALEKVANDWRERGFRTHDEIQSIEVQAFLDSRHVHYPEAWPDTHPQKRQASRPDEEDKA
jgi:hypothetical protein